VTLATVLVPSRASRAGQYIECDDAPPDLAAADLSPLCAGARGAGGSRTERSEVAEGPPASAAQRHGRGFDPSLRKRTRAPDQLIRRPSVEPAGVEPVVGLPAAPTLSRPTTRTYSSNGAAAVTLAVTPSKQCDKLVDGQSSLPDECPQRFPSSIPCGPVWSGGGKATAPVAEPCGSRADGPSRNPLFRTLGRPHGLR
jgi:hypothetical protein